MLTTLVGANVSSIVTHSSVTRGGDFILSIEDERLIVWDGKTFKMIKSDYLAEECTNDEACEIVQMCVAPDDKHVSFIIYFSIFLLIYLYYLQMEVL